MRKILKMKIVVFLKNWIGDTFFQFPAIQLIHEKYPNAKITCVAPPRCRELLAANPHIAEVLEFDEKTTHRSWLKRIGFIFMLRARGPWDQGYLFHRSKTRAMILALAGVKKRLGYGKGRGAWLTESVAEPSQKKHHVDYFLELLRGVGYDLPKESFYELPVSEGALDQANQLLKEMGLDGQDHFACFHLGANWEPKRWPAMHFAELADLIYSAWKIPVVVTGSAADSPLWAAMRIHIQKARVFSIIGKTTLPSLAALYSQAAFVVSGDSGPMHLAAAVGAPVVALFGPTDPELTGPRGSGETIVLKFVPEGVSVPYVGDAAEAKTWLAHISPEQVVEAILEKGWISQ